MVKVLANGSPLHSSVSSPVSVRNGGAPAASPLQTRDITEKKRASVRVFKHVESLTNQLIAKDKNFQAIYDVLMIQLVLFAAYVLIRDSIKAGRFYMDVSLLQKGVGSLPALGVVLMMEGCLVTSVVLVYPCFKTWELLHRKEWISPTLSGTFFAVLYASCVVSSGLMVSWIILTWPLPPFTTIIISVEQLRLSMKTYSFIRENAYKVLYPWHKDDQSGPAIWYAGQMSPKVGSFSQYVYFLVVPTLLYRDNYPRNKGPINWRNVAIYLIQFLTTIWFLGVLGKDFTFPSSLNAEELMWCYMNSLLITFLGYLVVQTCVFHSYMNLAAELLRFADREFYLDWWTSTTFSSYYRRWNTIVHDWIHSYIYADMKSILKRSYAAVCASTFISAFVHEYLLALVLRFASPVLFIEFAGLGVLFYLMPPFTKKRISNFIVMLSLSVGGANLIFYYQVEFASRLYCPRELTPASFFIPRIFECFNSSSI